MPIKILSDFDGVWTNQAREAEAVMARSVHVAAELAGVDEGAAAADFARIRADLAADPAATGWAPDGRRITAYGDEDLLLEGSALVHHLFLHGEAEPCARYHDAIRAGYGETLADFVRMANEVFLSATEAFRVHEEAEILPHTGEVLAALAAAGAEVVVVSNSHAEKLVHWFREAGVEAGEEPGAALRVVGDARKFVLGETDAALDAAGRRVFVDRPHYRAVIERERPDLVVGDVFSLDLALPHAMRGAGEDGAPATLVLRGHPHTPAWVREERAGGAIDHVIEDVRELVDLVRSAQATR